MPKTHLQKWVDQVCENLLKKDLRKIKGKNLSLTIVFLPQKAAQKLNFQYRQKKYATDILSFAGDLVEDLGDLVICPEVIEKQADEHKWSFKAEMSYMVLHGILHLLGYDHEQNETDAKIMFRLQDRIFNDLASLHGANRLLG